MKHLTGPWLAGCIIVGALLIGGPVSAGGSHAPTYHFTVVDIPSPPGSPPRLLTLNGIANNGTMSGNYNMLGGFGARVSPSLDVTPVLCSTADFIRYPYADTLGPQVIGMNNSRMVVGNDEGVTAEYGMLQTLDGTCTFFLVPQSVGTWATGINDLEHAVGYYWNATGLPDEPGLLRFHGFLRNQGGFVRLDGPGPRDVVFPTAINDRGDIVGYLYSDVQLDNSYVYHAFFYQNGVYHIVDYPGKEEVWLLDVNNRGQTVGVVGSNGGVGGQAFLLDRGQFFPLPKPSDATAYMLPTASNDHGAIVGAYTEVFHPEGDLTPEHERMVFHQFLATPIHGAHPDKGLYAVKNTHRRWAARDAGPRPTNLHPKHFVPLMDADGTVVLTNGDVVLGKKNH